MAVDVPVVGSAAAVTARPSVPLRHRTRLRSMAITAGHLLGSALDGLAVGFAVSYVAVVGISGLSEFLGLGPVLDIAVPLLIAGLAIGVMAGVLSGIVVGARRLRIGIDRRLEARDVGRTARVVIGLPLRIVGAIPSPAVPLIVATVTLAYGASTVVGPAGLLAPNAMIASIVYVGGLIGGLVGFARGVITTGQTTLRDTVPSPIPSSRARRMVAALAVGASLLLCAAMLAVAAYPGSTGHLVAPDAAFDGSVAVETSLTDPGEPGSFGVRTLSYGSGIDRQRPEFGAAATLITDPVDATQWLPRLENGDDEARTWFWGFDRDALPLDGLVWYPDGAGPFPLVIVVHGNHAMGQPSEPGYAYLGEHLASRGYVVASIDEDFLNGSWAGDWGGREQLVRAWLVRLHIAVLRDWSADPGNPLSGLVDPTRIATIGHSRGGEAASIAASWNGRDTAPLGLSPWPVGITIRTVVSIAPSDGQYTNDASLDLEGVDFLTLSGGHDADAVAWSGIRQYHRVAVAPGGFKAAMWVYRANHGQFNTVWGPNDQGPFSGFILDQAALLDGADQQRIARVAIGAFLEASLKDVDGYRGLFRRPMVGRDWLPDDIYLVASDDGTTRDLIDPAVGLDPTDPRVAVDAASATRGTIVEMPLRALQGSQMRRAIEITWTGSTTAADPSTATWRLTGISALAGSVQPASSTEVRLEVANATPLAEAAGRGLDPMVELTSTDGVTVALPLSTWGELPPPLTTQLLKSPLLEMLPGTIARLDSPVERVLQAYAIPLAAFEDADPAFHADQLDAIGLQFDRAAGAGALYVARLGLAGG